MIYPENAFENQESLRNDKLPDKERIVRLCSQYY